MVQGYPLTLNPNPEPLNARLQPLKRRRTGGAGADMCRPRGEAVEGGATVHRLVALPLREVEGGVGGGA